jgi:hypothetical protein
VPAPAQRPSVSFPALIASLTQALEQRRGLGDLHGQANAVNHLGSVQQEAGDHAAAVASLDNPLEHSRSLTDIRHRPLRRSTSYRLLAKYARRWADRMWAVEGARAKLPVRVRLLHTRNTGKSNPNQAQSVAIAALRSTTRAVACNARSSRAYDWTRNATELA